MTLDPRIAFYLNVATAIVLGLLGCTVYFTDIFGAHTTLVIMASLSIVLAILNAIAHAIPSKPDDAKAFYLGPKS